MYKISTIKIDGYTLYHAKPEKETQTAQTTQTETKEKVINNNTSQTKQEYYEKLKNEYFSDKDFSKKCETIDKLYLEKCKEINKLKDDNRKLMEKNKNLEETIKRHKVYEEYIEQFVELPFC